MAALQKFNRFVTDLVLKVHDLSLDAISIYLSNDTPFATDTVKADIIEIGIANGYTGPRNVSAVVTQNVGVMELSASDQVFTASGGNIGPFRYVILCNTSTTGSRLIGYIDYGSSITLLAGEMFTVDFPAILATLT